MFICDPGFHAALLRLSSGLIIIIIIIIIVIALLKILSPLQITATNPPSENSDNHILLS